MYVAGEYPRANLEVVASLVFVDSAVALLDEEEENQRKYRPSRFS